MNRYYTRNNVRNMSVPLRINSTKVDDNVGKIELWGEVYEDDPVDFWTGEPVKGDFITFSKFKNAMESVKDCSKVELHLFSYGGDATVGLTIANLIKSSKQHIIGVNDGICASAGMTILSACDEVRTHKSSLFMIHQTMGLCLGFYNNEDLSKVMECNSAYDSAAAEVYAAKTGMSKNQCLNLMKKTTWMSGAEALEKGFADALVPEEEETNSPVELVNKSTMRINGIEHNLDMFNLSDDFVTQAQKYVATISLGGNGKMANTEDLKDKLFNSIASIFASNSADDKPEEEKPKGEEKVNQEGEVEGEEENNTSSKNDTAEITEEEIQNRVNSAIKAERERIQAIQKLSEGADVALVNEAMFGETACDAGEFAIRLVNKENEVKKNALDNLKNDSKASKVNEVSAEGAELADPDEGTEEDAAQIAKAFKEQMENKLKEGK